MERNEVAAGVLAATGALVLASMAYAVVSKSRVGGFWTGVAVGALLLASATYCYLDMKHELALRVVWSVLFVFGGAFVAVLTLVGAARDGPASFLLYLAVVLALYLALIGTTAYDVYLRLQR